MANAATADLVSLAADLSAASGDSLMISAEKIIKDAAQKIQATAQANAPFKSGKLRASIRIRYVGPLTAIIGPSVDYGVYQEFGTGTRGEFPTGVYEIRPRNAKVLSWTSNGKRRFAKVVHHPGIKPHPFMRPAFEQVLGDDVVSALADAGLAAITRGPGAK